MSSTVPKMIKANFREIIEPDDSVEFAEGVVFFLMSHPTVTIKFQKVHKDYIDCKNGNQCTVGADTRHLVKTSHLKDDDRQFPANVKNVLKDQMYSIREFPDTVCVEDLNGKEICCLHGKNLGAPGRPSCAARQACLGGEGKKSPVIVLRKINTMSGGIRENPY